MAAAIADLNGDGKPGLAVLINQEASVNPTTLQTLFGNADGTFRTGPVATNLPYAFSLLVSDVSGDWLSGRDRHRSYECLPTEQR